MRGYQKKPFGCWMILLGAGFALWILSGCDLMGVARTPTPFPDAAYTAAAQTIIAQLTQVAPTATTGPILLPTPTRAEGEEAG